MLLLFRPHQAAAFTFCLDLSSVTILTVNWKSITNIENNHGIYRHLHVHFRKATNRGKTHRCHSMLTTTNQLYPIAAANLKQQNAETLNSPRLLRNHDCGNVLHSCEVMSTFTLLARKPQLLHAIDLAVFS